MVWWGVTVTVCCDVQDKCDGVTVMVYDNSVTV